MEPRCHDYLFASHQSREPAAQLVLAELNLSPLLHADMALGEGTGAVAVLPFLDMALAVYNHESTFEQINMKPTCPPSCKRYDDFVDRRQQMRQKLAG